MSYLLDTNICIYLLQGRPPALVQRISALRVGELAMSVITYAELMAGVQAGSTQRQRHARALQDFTELVPVLPFDEAAAREYARLRAAVRDCQRNAMDRLIAAHACSRGLTLVTNNEADFRVFPGLKVENWAA